MQERTPPRKKAVNLSIDAELLADAKSAGVNLSSALEAALRQRLHAEREELWRKENKAALDAYDQHIQKDGLWSDEFRDW